MAKHGTANPDKGSQGGDTTPTAANERQLEPYENPKPSANPLEGGWKP